jgi:putative ABC transport system substrate-binding protein
MRRRAFIGFVGGAVAWSSVVHAQQPKLPVVGYLGADSPELFASRLDAFRRGLSSQGFDEGRNVSIEYRWAHGRNDRLPALAAELVQRGVTVLVSPGSVAASLAARDATSTIPVVFENGADPIETGLVRSLNEPGGNVTGVTSLNAQVAPKRLELLHEIFPAATHFALLVNPTNRVNADATAAAVRAAASRRKLELTVVNASTEDELVSAFESLRSLRVTGLVVANETYFALRGGRLAELASRLSVPAVHQAREFVLAGGLMSYGGDVAQSHSQAGVYTGRVLRGEKPANLPVQLVTAVRLTINLKAAGSLALTMPASLLARADEIIE